MKDVDTLEVGFLMPLVDVHGVETPVTFFMEKDLGELNPVVEAPGLRLPTFDDVRNSDDNDAKIFALRHTRTPGTPYLTAFTTDAAYVLENIKGLLDQYGAVLLLNTENYEKVMTSLTTVERTKNADGL